MAPEDLLLPRETAGVGFGSRPSTEGGLRPQQPAGANGVAIGMSLESNGMETDGD